MPKKAVAAPAKTKRAKSHPNPAPAASIRSAEENRDQRLGFLMHDVSRLRRTVFDEFMKPLNVTRSQWWVLAFLSRHDGMIQNDLAGILELGKAALGCLIDRLEASGLVRRGADDSDRRAKRVFLSPARVMARGAGASRSFARPTQGLVLAFNIVPYYIPGSHRLGVEAPRIGCPVHFCSRSRTLR